VSNSKELDKRLKPVILDLLANIYQTSCNCRKEFKMKVHLHPELHLEDCPYRLKVMDTEAKSIFYG
jgi:hypothetical protein